MKPAALLLATAMLATCSVPPSPASQRLSPLADSVGDGGFVSSDPCGPPCFWNITPSRSTLDETIEQLRAHGVYDYCEFESPAEGGLEWIGCQFVITVAFEKGQSTVYSLSFSPSVDITMKDAIAVLGAPACAAVVPPLLPDKPIVSAHIFFPDPPVEIYLQSRDAVSYNIEAESIVVHVIYGPKGEPVYPSSCRAWTGYGEYVPDYIW